MGKRGKLKAMATIVLMIALMTVLVGDSAGSLPGMDTDLGDSDASFMGEKSWEYSGCQVAGAGDVNGDGYDDILIGAWGYGAENAGKTYLIFGKASGLSMDTRLANADASFKGENDGDYSGSSVAGVGDVNGDGYDDILISAPSNNRVGQTYLIFGKELGWSLNTNLSYSNASFWGEDAGDQSGSSVAGAGDVNGDGYDDILIGAYWNDDGGTWAGQTYLILGKASGWTIDTKLSNADASFLGEDSDDRSGLSVASAGDVNNDGYDDILIGATYNGEGGNSAGQTYLILGRPSGWAMDTNLSHANASFIGENAGDNSGWSVAGAGDVNGDSYDDILIGAWFNDDGGDNAGQTYLILGKASGWSMDTDLSNADASFWGESADDESGGTVVGAGDVDDDGYDDILIGADSNDEGGSNVGQTYLILGKEDGWSTDTFLSNADASFSGEDPGDYSGSSVAGAGDVNGDGYDDILTSADNDGDWLPYAGQTYLIFGGLRDKDDDGVPNDMDAFPEDIAASLDTDGDRFPDEWNPGMSEDDSTSNPKLVLDAIPDDPSEWNDTDGDGHGDNGDMYPEDPLEWADTDGDGYGDNGDAFPDDPIEWSDMDGDDHGDNYDDIFPNDPLEWADTDGDGHGDNGDAFPEGPFEWLDTDGDTHGDNGDAFPDNPLEWSDADDDGHGDNSDAFPTDQDEWVDTDGDGRGDNGDAFPDDAAASVDTDGDGYPDEWNPGKSKEDSTTGLKKDQFPDDPDKWKDENEEPSLGLVGALMAILVAALVAYNRRMNSWGKGAS